MGTPERGGEAKAAHAGASAAERARRALEALPRPPSAYPRLHPGPPGGGDPDAKQVAAIQRARIAGALMVELNERGGRRLTTRALYRRAGVAKEAFYRHYKGGVH